MRHNIVRRKVDPVLAPDQVSVARPLKPEDLDRCVTQHGIYPLLPAPNGVPWSEYVRSQRNRSRSISSSTEALESDHARYITRRLAQHARSMVLDHYLLIPLSHIFSQLREDMCQKVDLVIWVCRRIYVYPPM